MTTLGLLTEEEDTARAVLEAFQPDFEVVRFLSAASFISDFAEKTVELLILDYDLPLPKSLELFRQIRRISPHLPVIMISGLASIPDAVIATKMGVADFLRKPLQKDRLKSAVDHVLRRTKEGSRAWVSALPEAQWLMGQGAKIREFMSSLWEAIDQSRDVVLEGEAGLDCSAIVQLIHWGSPTRKRILRKLDLSRFEKEGAEAQFWVAIRELLEERDLPVGEESKLCGTLFLTGFERLPKHFQDSVVEFLNTRREGRGRFQVDRAIRVALELTQTRDGLSSFVRLEVPPLRDRKDDLIGLIALFVEGFSKKHGFYAPLVSTAFLRWLSDYDYPGNIEELKSIIEQAILRAQGVGSLSVKEFPLSVRMIQDAVLQEVNFQGDVPLDEALAIFEKRFLAVVLEKMNFDEDLTAQFLDLPRTALTDKVRRYGLKTSV